MLDRDEQRCPAGGDTGASHDSRGRFGRDKKLSQGELRYCRKSGKNNQTSTGLTAT